MGNQKCDENCGFCVGTATNCTHCFNGFKLQLADEVTKEHTCVEVTEPETTPEATPEENKLAEVLEPVAVEETTEVEEEPMCHEKCAKCNSDDSQSCDACKFGYDRVFDKETKTYTCENNGAIGQAAVGLGTGGIAIIALGVAVKRYFKKKGESVEELRSKRLTILNNNEMFQASLLSSYQL